MDDTFDPSDPGAPEERGPLEGGDLVLVAPGALETGVMAPASDRFLVDQEGGLWLILEKQEDGYLLAQYSFLNYLDHRLN